MLFTLVAYYYFLFICSCSALSQYISFYTLNAADICMPVHWWFHYPLYGMWNISCMPCFLELSSHASYEEIREDTLYSTTLRYDSRSDAGNIGTMLDMNRDESSSSRFQLEEGASSRFQSEEGASSQFQSEEGSEESLRCSSYAIVPAVHERPNIFDLDIGNLKCETRVVTAEINHTPWESEQFQLTHGSTRLENPKRNHHDQFIYTCSCLVISTKILNYCFQ